METKAAERIQSLSERQRPSGGALRPLGWQVDDHETFDTIEARVGSHGVPVTAGSAEEAALRGVERLVRFPGPNGLMQEIYVNARSASQPLSLPHTADSSAARAVWGT